MPTEEEEEEPFRPLSSFEKSLFKRKNYTIIEPAMSKGGFCRVYRCQRNGEIMAVKVIDCEHQTENYRYKFLPRELYVLKKLKHPFIVKVEDIYTVGNRVFVFMELCAIDSLDMLKKCPPLTEPRSQLLFKQVSSGLEYMHGLGIAHRDIKCENILVNANQTIAKLTDFGFARKVYDQTTGYKILTETHCGSTAYVAPEVLQPDPFDPIRADCWSMGVVLYMWTNDAFPFSDRHNTRRQLRKQMRKEYNFVKELSNDCKDLIENLLEPDRKLRYTMPMVLKHKWLLNVKLQTNVR